MTIDRGLLRSERIGDSEDGNVSDSSELGGSARSAFGYFGSKHRLAKKILPHLPHHNRWVELFCGSAALTLTKSPVDIEIINDLDEEIVNVFRQLREHPEEIIKAVSTTPYARQEYIQASRDTENCSELERARRFLVRAMMSINGVQGKARGGFSFSNSFTRGGAEARVSRWKNFPERLEAVVLRLRNVRIECRDAVDLLSDLSDSPATLVYVDPPYLSRRAMGYSVEANEEAFHAKLLRQVNRSKCMIAISAYESAVYSKLLSKSDGWLRVDLDAHTKATDGNQRKRGEILWLNSAASNALKGESVTIQLSLEDRRNNDSGRLRAEGIRDSEDGREDENVSNSSEPGDSARSAFGYLGSKGRLAKEILPHLPHHHCWVELFCGPVPLTLTKSPVGIEIINDLDEEIVNVFRQLREHPAEVIQAVPTTPHARQEYIQATRDTENCSELERARRFLVQAMMSINGVQCKARGGFSFSNAFTRGGTETRISRWKNFPEGLEAVVMRLRNVRIEYRDAVDLLSDLSDRPATLVYVDPPYRSIRAMGYSLEANEEAFHARLLRQVNRSKCMIAIRAYESAVYSKFLSKSNGWSKVDLDAHTKATDSNQRKRGEILWLNLAASDALKSESVPIQLSLEERRNNKTNPVR